MARRDPPAPRRRPRNASATRGAILAAARTLFTERAYEQVGVRHIAQRAGVNSALVSRYFGSKMELFASAVSGRFALDNTTGGRPLDAERIARVMLREPPGCNDAVLALVRSAADPEAGAILKKGLEEEFIKPFAAVLPGKGAAERAGLITAYLLGLAIARDVLRIDALSHNSGRLIALVAPIIQVYMDDSVVRSRVSDAQDAGKTLSHRTSAKRPSASSLES